MGVFRYIIRRLALGVFVLLSVMTITFLLSHSIGGNPIVAWLGKAAALHPELAAQYAIRYHLNDPVYVQYYYYLVNLLQGNLGYSPSRGFLPVSQVIADTLPYTVQIAVSAFIITLVLGVPLGVLSARYHRKAVDRSITAFYFAGTSSPPFFIGLVFLIVFTLQLGMLPSGGAFDQTLSPPTAITHLPILDGLIQGDVPFFLSSMDHLILPSLTLALGTFGFVTRVLKSSMLEVMQASYIRTARAKGLDERTVFFKHGLRNAVIPVVTLSSLILTWLITGTIFVENIFAYPGIGQYVVTALAGQDYPGILATTLIFAIIIVVANLAADVLYAVIDPQIRLK